MTLSADNQILMGGLWYCAKHGIPPDADLLTRIENQLRDSDTRRMAETPKSGSVRSTGSAGPEDIAQ